MKQQSIVIVYLSLSLLVLQWMYIKSERRNAYLEGKQAVHNSFSEMENYNNCYAKDGDCTHNANEK